MTIRPPDLSLYLVIGPESVPGRDVRRVALEAVAGGVTAVQLRYKQASVRELVEVAGSLTDELVPRGVPVFVNDRLDIALAAGASGVHVGQEDLAARDVRRIAGNELLLGVSATTVVEASAVEVELADYLGIGPVFPTPSKADAAPPLGVAGLAAAVQVAQLPVVAIGGITEENAAGVIGAGASGIAVISAICAAADPRAAAERLRRIVDDARRGVGVGGGP